MYLEFFGLREKPFNVTPDPHFLYMSPSHQEAFANLLYGVRERKGFVMVTGEVGTGKTTLLHNLLANLDDDIQSVFVFHTGIDFDELLEMIHHDLGIEVGSGTKAAMLQGLNRYLIEQLEQNRNVALIIDEAQNLSPEILENLRLLSNLETAKDKLLQIVLVGQPELEEKMALPQLRQLKQRIAVHGVIDTLDQADSRAYVRHRLTVAGAPDLGRRIFSEEALGIIVHAAGGVPRQLNILCDNALLIAYADGSQQANSAHAREAIRDHGLTTPSAQRQAVSASLPTSVALPASEPPRVKRSRFGLFGVILLTIALSVIGGYFVGQLSKPAPEAAPGEAAPPTAADRSATESAHESADEVEVAADSVTAPADAPNSNEPATWGEQPQSRTGTPITMVPRPAERTSSPPPAAPPATVEQTSTAAEPEPEPEPETPRAESTAPLEASGQEDPTPIVSNPQPTPPPATAAASSPTTEPETEPEAEIIYRSGPPPLPFTDDELEEEEGVWIDPVNDVGGSHDLRSRYLLATSLAELQEVLDHIPRRTYTVRPGESFREIALAQTGRNDDLAKLSLERMNTHVANSERITAGLILYLPNFEAGTERGGP